MASNIIRFLGVNSPRHSASARSARDSDLSFVLEKDGPELQDRLEALKIPLKDVLGKNYKPKKRHKVQPVEVKQRMVQNQCIAYSSLPYSDLEKIPECPVPAALTRRQTEKQLHATKQDTPRQKGCRNRREETDFQGTPLMKRHSLMPR